MSKRSSYEIKKKILLKVQETPASYAQLERKLSTGYRTIKANCEELAAYDLISIKKMKHPANGRDYNVVKITPQGLKMAKKK